MNLWIYQADRQLSDEEKLSFKNDLQEFTDRWNAHGKKLTAGFELPYNQFIVLKVDEEQAKASGCSIDDSVRFIKTLEQKYNLSLFDRTNMAYLKNDHVHLAPLNKISSLVSQGEINPDTIVFVNTISDQKDFPIRWQLPLKETAYANFV